MSKPDETKKTTTLQVWGIPAKVRRDFKAACGRKGMSMKTAILQLIREFTTK